MISRLLGTAVAWFSFIGSASIARTRKIRSGPKFFLIGVQKGGTTSLHDLLVQNPLICAARNKTRNFKDKEIHFFEYGSIYKKGNDWYVQQFQKSCPSDARAGYIDSTPNYYMITPTIPERMKETFTEEALREKKLLLVLRNPIDREISWYNFIYHICSGQLNKMKNKLPSGVLAVTRPVDSLTGARGSWKIEHYNGQADAPESIKRFISVCRHCLPLVSPYKPLNGTSKRLFLHSLATFKEYYQFQLRYYMRDGFYIDHIKNYLNVFDRKQLLIISFDDLLKNTSAVMQSIASHFQVPNTWGSKAKLPHTNTEKHVAVLDCETYQDMSRVYTPWNSELYRFLERGDKPLYELPFTKFKPNTKVCFDRKETADENRKRLRNESSVRDEAENDKNNKKKKTTSSKRKGRRRKRAAELKMQDGNHNK